MAENVHGHAILERIIEAGGEMTLATLRAFANDGYGSDAKYHTCSASGMNLDELLAFLVSRNKIRIQGEQVIVFAENMCRHGDHAGDAHSHH